MLYKGSCHCGAIRFEVDADSEVRSEQCNCSICAKTGFLHLIVPASRFRLIKGGESITTYTFNTGVAQHYFCRVCGVRPYYVPRSNPDGFDVNVRCLEPQPERIEVVAFDGLNWEKNAGDLAHLSRDD
jgi:hypothetical protein